jgi:hypothetical protein
MFFNGENPVSDEENTNTAEKNPFYKNKDIKKRDKC